MLHGSPIERRAMLRMALGGCAGFTVAGCGGTTSQRPSPSSAQSGFPRTLDHAAGRTTIERRPQRVAALDQTFVDATLALGAEVIAFTTYPTLGDSLPDYLGEKPLAQAPEAQPVGALQDPSIEKLATLSPDLILSANVRHSQQYSKLVSIAATVFSETTGAPFKNNLRLTGRALGRVDRATSVIREYEARAGRIGSAIKTQLGKMPTVSPVRFSGEPTARLYTEHSYLGIVLKDIGFRRPPGQPASNDISVDISQERIPSLDADRIFLAVYDGENGSSREVENRFRSNELWSRLQGDIVGVNDLVWLTSVGVLGAHAILDDVQRQFGVTA